MKEIEPTLDHLQDPYVLQLLEAIAKRDDEIERLTAENDELNWKIECEATISRNNNEQLLYENQELRDKIEHLTAKVKDAFYEGYYFGGTNQIDEDIAWESYCQGDKDNED